MSLAESYSGMSSPPHDFGKADDHLKDSRLSIVNNQLEEDEVLETEVGALKKAKAKSFTWNLLVKITGSVFQSLISLFACVVYVVQTYNDDEDGTEGTFFALELLIALLFTIDYLFGMYLARDKKEFMLEPLNLLDLVTILPVFITILGEAERSGSFAFARGLRVLRAFRVLRLYRLFTTTKESENIDSGGPVLDQSEIKRQRLIIICTLLAVIFISTGVIHSLQDTSSEQFNIGLTDWDTEMTFATALYFTVISLSTVGYGDMSPTTDEARIFIGLFLIIVIVIFSQQTSRLSELSKHDSPYREPYKGEPFKHIVITGSFNGTTLYRFIRELYHPDHNMKYKDCKIVIVRNEFPNRDISALLNHPVYSEFVRYLEGDFMNEKTLMDAMTFESRGVFILSNQYDSDFEHADTFAVLAASVVKQEFVEKAGSSSPPVFLQLVSPDHMVHKIWADWEEGFSSWGMKTSILAANAFTPGLSTLISNLVISTSNAMRKEAQNSHWMNEYINGLSNEIYLVPFPSHLVGAKFAEVVKALYIENNSLLFAVQTTLQIEGAMTATILMNPVNYIIKDEDNAFVISADIEFANGIEDINIEGLIMPDLSQSDIEWIQVLRSPNIKLSDKNSIVKTVYKMHDDDLRGTFWDHILVFGSFEHLVIMLKSFSQNSDQIIGFVSERQPPNKWKQLSKQYPGVVYIECSFSNLNELSHTAINFAYHTILLSSRIPNSSVEDSGILPLITLLESNFSCPFTVELVDEANLIYLDKKPSLGLESMPHVTWPRYAASNVFFSGTLDYIMGAGFHNKYLIQLMSRFVQYEDMIQKTQIDENYRINSIQIPELPQGAVKYGEVLCYFLSLPRPVICLGIYRTVGILDNLTPYVYTKPDINSLVFSGDRIIILGEIQSRDHSPLLKFLGRKQKENVLNIQKGATTYSVFKESISETVTKILAEDLDDTNHELSDEALVEQFRQQLQTTKQAREILHQQSKMIKNVAHEYQVLNGLLQGQSHQEVLAQNKAIDGLTDNED